MEHTLEKSTQFKASGIASVNVGDQLVNLGKVIEINEADDCYSLVIFRMNQRQVWTFEKDDILFILE